MHKLFAIAFLLVSLDASAQNIQRVANINPSGSSFASDFMIFNDRIYFVASDSETRSQLWVTDGTEQGTNLVKNFCSGANCYFPHMLAVLNDHLVFAAPYNNSFALWSSDGTPGGTQMIKEVEVAACCTEYKRVILNNKLYFTGNDGSSGNELWCTDGTATGTYMVADIRHGFDGSDPHELCTFNGTICFAAGDSANNTEPWISDGTDTGTHMLVDVSPSGSSDPRAFFSL
jgi:ELWxxDGT repeat protein